MQQQQVDAGTTFGRPLLLVEPRPLRGVTPSERRGLSRRQRSASSPRLSKAAAPAAAAPSDIASPRSFVLSQQRPRSRRHGPAHAAAHSGLLLHPQRLCALAVRPRR